MSETLPIPASSRVAIVTTTAGQAALTIPFPFLADADIAILRRSVDGAMSWLSRPAHYTLTGRGTPTGGTATLKPAHLAKNGEIYTIVGMAVIARATSIVAAGRFSSAQHDLELDRLTVIAQELARDADRALKAPYGQSGGTVDVAAAGTIPVHDGAGNLVAGPSAAALEAVEVALAVDAGRALIHGTGGDDPYAAGGRRLAGLGAGIEPADAVTRAQLDEVIGDIDPEGLLARVEALEATMGEIVEPGDIKITAKRHLSDPPGWLLLDQVRTIGDAGSGATALAAAGAWACYAAVWASWSNSECPIFTAAGVPATRGADAASDFAAGKRLQLPPAADRFPRFSGTRAHGTREASQNKLHNHGASLAADPHDHTITSDGGRHGSFGQNPGGAFYTSDGNVNDGYGNPTQPTSSKTITGTVTINSDGGSEARPDSLVLNALIRL